MKVIKRDGSTVKFDWNKIYNAITKAWKDVHGTDEQVVDLWLEFQRTWDYCNTEKDLHVEDIQNAVENFLMGHDTSVARAYIIYRYEHNLLRKDSNSLVKSITKKLMANDVVNQNANVDEYSFSGRVGEASDFVLKEYALQNCMSKMARKNHENNEIYIHDLSHYTIGDHNCISLPIDDLLAKGFTTRKVDIRPANSISTACQLTAVVFQIQSLQQFGGESCTHYDWTLVPYVRKSFSKYFKEGAFHIHDEKVEVDSTKPIDDIEYWSSLVYDKHFVRIYDYAYDMTKRELDQAIEGLYHNLNSLMSRSGAQLPFSSLNYGTCTLKEGRMVTQSLLENSIKGVGPKHLTPIFPCGIFQMMKGVNRSEGDPNYDLYQLALKSTSLRLYPNYANCDWSGNEGYDNDDPNTYFSTINNPVVSYGDVA